MPGSDPFNFLTQDFRDYAPAGAQVPQLRKPRVPKPIPEIEILFQVQTDLLKAIRAFGDKQEDAGKQSVEHAYRSIAGWLKEHG